MMLMMPPDAEGKLKDVPSAEGLLDDAVKKLRATPEKKASIEIMVQSGESRSCSAEKGKIVDFRNSNSFGIGVRIVLNGRVGFASCNRAELFGNTLEKAINTSRIGEKLAGLPQASNDYPDPEGCFDSRILILSDARIIDNVESMLAILNQSGVRPTYAGMSAGSAFQEIANSNGVRITDKDTEVSAGTYVTIDTSVGWWGEIEKNIARINVEEIAKKAASMALESRGAEKTVSGKMPVVLRPHCISEEGGSGLFEAAFVPSINGDRVVRGNSRLNPKLIGTTAFDPTLDIVDDGTLPKGLGSGRCDGEGVPTQRTVICEGGVLKSFIHDHASALKAGLAESTGNGFRDYASTPFPRPSNLVFSSRNAVPEAELIEGISEGILVNWLSGTHTANDYSGDFSVEAKNAFLIKNGKISEPIKCAMISGNVFEMLRNLKLASDNSIQPASIRTPSVVAELNVVG